MQSASAQFAAFVRSQTKTPAAYIKVQLPNTTPLFDSQGALQIAGGSLAASQFVLPNLTGMRLSRSEDVSTDTASFTLNDEPSDFSSLNPTSKYGVAFGPGVIDNKFIIYMGFRGPLAQSSGSSINNMSLLQMFTGYIETDQQDPQSFNVGKTVSLLDLTRQFRFQVYDTFPHQLAGNQTLPQFDEDYNLTNPSGDGKTWVCDGKMFTVSSSDPVWGSTHVDIAVYVDTTGDTPQGTPLDTGGNYNVYAFNQLRLGRCSAYQFDYNNGILYLTSAIPPTSAVSIAGNPTYMAPEVMVRKILVEKAGWNPKFLSLSTSGIYLPQFAGNNQPAWQCLQQIAVMTNPRFIPWKITATEGGVVAFYEQNYDGPSVKRFVDERDFLQCSYINTSRNLLTVCRADASVMTMTGSTQALSSIAYDLKNVIEYGLTEPLQLDASLVQSITNLDLTSAESLLNSLTVSQLQSTCRPVFTLSANIWPDPSLQIDDCLKVQSKATGVDTYMRVTQQGFDLSQPPQFGHSVTLEEIPEFANYAFGVPAGVTQDTSGLTPSAVVGPTYPVIGAVQLGSFGEYPILNSAINTNPANNLPIIPTWDLSYGKIPSFNLFLNAAPVTNASISPGNGYQFDYTHLPSGITWQPTEQSNSNLTTWPPAPPASNTVTTVYYGKDGTNDGSGHPYYYYVGPDSVFYKYAVADGQNYAFTAGDYSGDIYTPNGNTSSNALVTNSTAGYQTTPATVYLWQWWYLCLDSRLGVGKASRLVQRVNPSQDGQGISVDGTTAGLWVKNTWSGPPGPDANSVLYGNVTAGITNYVDTPTGFVGADIHQSGSNILYGVAFGDTIGQTYPYVGYEKRTRGHYCVLAASSTGAIQFLRIPFRVVM